MQYDDAMPAILDREISNTAEDAFGHRHFAQALRSLIESKNYRPPFSIGLLGGWGTGKSSIKELYTADLCDDATLLDGQVRSARIHCVTFNAWRFGGREQDIKRALLRHVFLELGGDEENLQDRLFRQISKTEETPKPWRTVTGELLRAWAMPLPALIVVLALLVASLFIAKLLLHPGDISQAVLFACITGIYTYVLKHLKPSEVKTTSGLTRIALPSTSSEQYEDMLLSQLKLYKKGKSNSLDGRNGKTCERLVVFVDDLDRLSSDEMVLGLDAVRTFMEIPTSRLPKGMGLVFVISCDEGKIADALARGRRTGELPATVFNHSDARRYLDRIFQFRLEIPPPPRNDMRGFATRQLRRLTHIASDLERRGVALEALIDRMIHVGVNDPRNALQLVNAFAQAWWIAVRREREGVGSDLPGGLHDGAVTNHPISLGALCAMKVSFPDFYGNLQEDPLFLRAFIDVVAMGRPLEGLPESSRKRLIDVYLLEQKPDEEVLDVKPEHRPLRQFITSLNGLRWADPIQSLLLLSEDPITRRLGSKISAIHNAFVSGDTRGVLEGMGRHVDTSPLTLEQAQSLSLLYEGTATETAARRSNAARVISDLIDRIPQPRAGRLLAELCRDIDNSLDLRSQLGPVRIANLLSGAENEDLRSVTSRLVKDLLVLDGPIALQLETLGTPGLDEAEEMVQAVVPLAISIRIRCGLDTDADDSLLSWLVNRHVESADGNRMQLPYQNLEDWLAKDDGTVAEGLGTRYLEALAAELNTNDQVAFNVEWAALRAQSIFEKQMPGGEEMREALWEVLPAYFGSPYRCAVEIAWTVGVPALGKANDEQASTFVAAFAKRLSSNGDESVDLDDAFDFVARAVTDKLQSLNQEALTALVNLTNQWSNADATAEKACDMAQRLIPLGTSIEEQLTTNWASRLMTTLPLPSIRFLASRFNKQPGAVKATIVSALNTTITAAGVDATTQTRLKAFVDAMRPESWSASPLIECLNGLLPQLSTRFNNPNGYLDSVFPIFAPILSRATPATYGAHVQQIFTQAKAQAPNVYPLLHGWMVENWQQSAVERNPYDPAAIFEEAANFVQAYPTLPNGNILRSMRDMLDRDIVPVSKSPRLLDSASIVWKASPEETADIISAYPQLTVAQASQLITSIDGKDAAHLSALQRTWMRVSQEMDTKTNADTFRALLVSNPVTTFDETDAGLKIWLTVQADAGESLLSASLIASDITDEQRLRLWRQASQRAEKFDAEFLIRAISKLLTLSPIEMTAKAVFDDRERITSVLGTKENQSKLARELMNAFSEAKTNTVKTEICNYCLALAGQAVLKSLAPVNLSSDEFKIIETIFTKSSELTRLRQLVTES